MFLFQKVCFSQENPHYKMHPHLLIRNVIPVSFIIRVKTRLTNGILRKIEGPKIIILVTPEGPHVLGP